MLLAFVLAILIAGCSTKDNTENTPEATDGATPEATLESTPASEPLKEVTLRFSFPGESSANGVFNQITDAFTKLHPNIKVVIEAYPADQFANMLKTKMAAGDGPDIMSNNLVDFYMEFAKTGQFVEVSDMTDIIGRLAEGSTDLIKQDGKLYGFPTQVQTIFMYYNKKMFSDLGLSVPKTWDEFIAVNEAVKNAKIVPIVQGIKDGWTSLMMPYQLTPSLVDNKYPDFGKELAAGTAKFSTNPGYLDAFGKIEYLNKQGYFNEGILSTTDVQAQQMFATGKAAMYPSGNWAAGGIDGLKPDFEVGGFPIPIGAGDEYAALANPYAAYSINAKSENPQEARLFYEFLYTDENMASIAEESQSPSPNKNATVKLNPAILEAMAYAKDKKVFGFPSLQESWLLGVEDTWYKSFQELYAGRKDAKQVLESMDEAYAKAKK